MKVNGTQSTPLLAPNQFSVQELHDLATDPDFKVTVDHAVKIGVHTFEHAKALLSERPLSNQSIIAMMKIMRSHLMWLVGPASGKLQRIGRELSDTKLQELDVSTGKLPPALFRSQIELLAETVRDILEDETKEKFSQEICRLVASAKDERDAAEVLLPMILSFTIPVWEQRAARDVQRGSGYYVGWAASSDQAFFAQAPFAYFANGQTARIVRECLREPQRFGVSVAGLSGTYAVHHLQAAMLCDLITSNLASPALSETFQLDAGHIRRLGKAFANLVQAQTAVDFCGRWVTGDKDDLFKKIHFAICQNDETFGINIKPEQLAQLKAMISAENNPVMKLHRSRLHKMLLDSLNKFQVEDKTFAQWHYSKAMTENLKTMRDHLVRILDVNYRVFSNIYYTILENEIDSLIASSLLDFEEEPGFRDWLPEQLQTQAFKIRDDFRAVARSLIPIVTKGRAPDLIPSMRLCLLHNRGWAELYHVLQGGGPSTDFQEIKAKLVSLFNELNILRAQQRGTRFSEAMREKGRVLPHQLKTGFR